MYLINLNDVMTIFSFRCDRSNVFFPSAQIDDSVASLVIAQLLFLQSESNNKPIHMYINSPGKTTVYYDLQWREIVFIKLNIQPKKCNI